MVSTTKDTEEVALTMQFMSHFFVSFELQVQRPARGLPNLGNRVRGTANVSLRI